MSVLYPTYLWGLLGVIVPILIHLWSKKQRATIKVGSIQFIKPTQTNRASSMYPNEWILLLLRSAIIGIVTLILSGLQLNQRLHSYEVAYFVEPSLKASIRIQNLIDASKSNVGLFSLEPGFPELISKRKTDTIPNQLFYWQLARELEHFPADSIVLLTRGYVKNIVGKRPSLSKNIKWIQAEGSSEILTKSITAVESKNQTTTYAIKSNDHHTQFLKRRSEGSQNKNNTQIDSLITSQASPILVRKELTVGLKVDDTFAFQKPFIKALLAVVSDHLDVAIKSEEVATSTIRKDRDLLIWMSEEEPPTTQATVLYYQPDIFAKKLLIKRNGKSYQVTQLLNVKNSVEQHLADELVVILGSSAIIKEKAKIFDQRKIAVNELETKHDFKATIHNQIQKSSMETYLYIVLLLLLIAERIFSKIRRQ